jgi:gliding motility-associated-like protein
VILKVENPYPVSSGGSGLTIGQLNYIKVVDVPNVTIIPPGQSRSDTTVRFGQSVNLTGSGAKTFEWSPNYNITSLTKPKVTVTPFKTTQYILTGYNSKNCFSSDTINVIIIDDCGEMYVPNAFTPNNDGVNDVLYVRGICLQSLTFMVFNRWGEKVFETNDQKHGWDGTYKGEELNTGVFVYRLEGKTYDGKGFSSKGNITLIR